MKKRSYYSSLFRYLCPRCRVGRLFLEPFKLSNPLAMHKRCSYCNLNFEPEPGFYWGAMFLSYIISSLPLLGIVVACMFVLDWSVGASLLTGFAIAGLCYFKLMRFSRSLWIHLMVRFEPTAGHVVGENETN